MPINRASPAMGSSPHVTLEFTLAIRLRFLTNPLITARAFLRRNDSLSLLIFRKAGLNYLQHLVFSLHLHSFFMLFQLVSNGWSLMAGLISGPLASFLSIAGMIYMPVYAYRALRNVFGQHRRGTLLRGVLLLSLYGLVIILGFLGTLLAAVLLA